MPAAFSISDCAALLGCCLAALAVAVWAGRSIRTSDDLLAGGRKAPWALVGFGFALAGPVAVCIAVFPREGYFAGLGLLWIPAMLGAAAPVVLWLGSRLYYNLDPDSIPTRTGHCGMPTGWWTAKAAWRSTDWPRGTAAPAPVSPANACGSAGSGGARTNSFHGSWRGTWGIVAESEAGRSPQAADRREHDIVWLDREDRPSQRPWSG